MSPITPALVVADLPYVAYDAAVGVLSRGMRDNPLHVAAYGDDPERRERVHGRLVRALFRTSPHNRPIGLWRDGALVACTGVLLDGCCCPGVLQSARMMPAIAAVGPRTAARLNDWVKVWRAHEPAEPHAHLGPFAVDRHLQGEGLGSALLAEHCRRLDDAGLLGYLETDRPENVRFYERAGYEVVGEAPTIGVTSWFMRRAPGAPALTA